jgi:TolA-binding protein
MKFRHLLAAFTLGAVALVGTAGAAVAQDATSTPSTTAKTKASICANATARLPKIKDRETNVEARIDKLNTRLATAQQGNHADAVKVIQFRLDWLQKVDGHLKDATNLITSECPAS